MIRIILVCLVYFGLVGCFGRSHLRNQSTNTVSYDVTTNYNIAGKTISVHYESKATMEVVSNSLYWYSILKEREQSPLKINQLEFLHIVAPMINTDVTNDGGMIIISDEEANSFHQTMLLSVGHKQSTNHMDGSVAPFTFEVVE